MDSTGYSMVNPEMILEHMTEIMIFIDYDARIVFFNEAAASSEILTKGKLQKGMSFLDMCPDKYRSITRHIIEQLTHGGAAQQTEIAFDHPRGHKIYMEFHYKPVTKQSNIPELICVTGKDITDQKIFEHKTAELNHALAELTENANAVIFSVDAQGYITTWNLECSRITGFEATELLAKPLRYFIRDKYHVALENLFQQVLAGRAVGNFEVEMLTQNNKYSLTLLLNATPKRSPQRKVIGVLFVGQDITELSEYRAGLEKKVEDRTRKLKLALTKEKQLVELKNKFVSIASHEFRIPLGAIRSTVKKLESSDRLYKEEREGLKGIDLQVSHMKMLLEDVLTLEKTGLADLSATVKRIDVVLVLNTIADEVTEATKHTHEIIRDFASAEMYIEADEKLLRNIFLNLLTNAIKFSPGRTSVALRAFYRIPGHVTVSVQDNGIGILPQDRKRIFEAFNRGSNTSSITGTGLGLSIVKRAAEALGAIVELESAPGKGTTVSVQFYPR